MDSSDVILYIVLTVVGLTGAGWLRLSPPSMVYCGVMCYSIVFLLW